MKVALICGGPSLERGISLNSARTVLDHLESDVIEIIPFYLDRHKNPYALSKSQLYSNTPSDFDFKLESTAKKLTEKKFISLLKQVDIVFPIMHGRYGEDGTIQAFLEKNSIPFVGTGSTSCKQLFDKNKAQSFLRENGFYTLPSIPLKIHDATNTRRVRSFFRKNKLSRAIVKPARGGSSIGVFSVHSPEEALEKMQFLFSKRIDTRVVLEPFCTGIEFTVIVLQNKFGLPVSFIPTEIDIDYTKNQTFDYRRKYLPTHQVSWHCPPRFSHETIETIRSEAENIFLAFEMRDFARIDGWLLPDGKIWFPDINPISGMEQNSFLFQQTSRLGMSHTDTLQFIVRHACKRYHIPFPQKQPSSKKKKQSLAVLFGGITSERQVSLMSGTNTWLKLRKSKKYLPTPYFLDSQKNVWRIPYTLALNHTTEEIERNCLHAKKDYTRLKQLLHQVHSRLLIDPDDATEEYFIPQKLSLKKLIHQYSYIFLGLHGGMGEDGTIQKLLEKHHVSHNGSGVETSSKCINKWKTNQYIRSLHLDGMSIAPQKEVSLKHFIRFSTKDYQLFWKSLRKELSSKTVIAKPPSDGCSSGVAHLCSSTDLKKYIHYLSNAHIRHIPAKTFSNQPENIELSNNRTGSVLFEKYISTTPIHIKQNKLSHPKDIHWLEVTIGVIEKNNTYHAFSPSITIAEGAVLSVEEKFQGGTGVNLTPPPKNIISPTLCKRAQKNIEKLSKKMRIQNYARIDAFLHAKTGELSIIEVNTLPALTPSTVLFHQALAENPSLSPIAFLEMLVQNSFIKK